MGRQYTRQSSERTRKKTKGQHPTVHVRWQCRWGSRPLERFRCTLRRIWDVRLINMSKSAGAVIEGSWDGTEVHRRRTRGKVPSRSTAEGIRCSQKTAARAALRHHRRPGYTGLGIAVLTDRLASRTDEACCMTARAAHVASESSA
jgi:hypothetical protein